VGWKKCFKEQQALTYAPGQKSRVDQDLRTVTVSILSALYEYGPIQCNLSQVFNFLACTEDELKNNRLHVGVNERGINDTTREVIFNKYMTNGYRGTGIESINNVILLNNSELTALLTLEHMDDETEMPLSKNKMELFDLLRPALENREKCEELVTKWLKFKEFFPKVKDADEKKVFRHKWMVPWAGQNRVNAASRLGSSEGDQDRFRAMERWTMTFWALMPRKVTQYLSQENQGRDGCKQTILDCEEIFNAADNRNKLILWDKYHKRWARLDAAEQTKYVFQSVPR